MLSVCLNVCMCFVLCVHGCLCVYCVIHGLFNQWISLSLTAPNCSIKQSFFSLDQKSIKQSSVFVCVRVCLCWVFLVQKDLVHDKTSMGVYLDIQPSALNVQFYVFIYIYLCMYVCMYVLLCVCVSYTRLSNQVIMSLAYYSPRLQWQTIVSPLSLPLFLWSYDTIELS